MSAATQMTSKEAFDHISTTGLLKKLKLSVYEFIFKNPGCIQDDILQTLSSQGSNTGSITARLGELEKAGFIKVVGTAVGRSGRKQCRWETTSVIPASLLNWQQKLTAMGFSCLDEYYQSLIWKNRVAEYWATHERRCFISGATDDLQLHHITYDNIGAEPDDDLVPLCRTMHELVHQLIKDHRIKLHEAHLVVKKARS